MRYFLSTLLYIGLSLNAIAAHADVDAAKALRSGDMQKLVFHEESKPVSALPFELPGGEGQKTLDEYSGKHVLLNFWATWCAPCRHEMPMFAELQERFGGDDFAVVTVAVGPHGSGKIAEFFDEIGVQNLPQYHDPRMRLSGEMGVLGLPVTAILSPDGREIARLSGPADWSSETAVQIISTLIGEH